MDVTLSPEAPGASGAQATTTRVEAAPYQAAVTIAGPPERPDGDEGGPSWHGHRHLTRGNTVLLAQPEVHIGVMESNDIVISGPGVSRHHAVIRWTPGGYQVEDLGSTGGTYVDGRRLTGPATLAPGQHIRIGDADLLFQVLEGHHHLAGVPPHHHGVAAVAAVPAQAFNALALHARKTPLRHWAATQGRKRYWRVFVGGLIAYLAAWWALTFTGNLYGVPLPLLVGSLIVPVTFVLFCWEEGAFVDMPAPVVGLAFISGGVLGLALSWLLENYLVNGEGVGPSLVTALVEETAKVAAVVWFLRDRRLRGELDGLVLGAAAGMGFAALETAGYGFGTFLDGYTNAQGFGSHQADQFYAGVGAMIAELNTRMTLAFFGHGVWTAIIVAAIWRDRRNRLPRLTPGVVLAFAIAVGLHTVWDVIAGQTDALWPLVVLGVIGLFVLRFFIMESLERAKLGPGAPPPPPLYKALARYILHPIHGGPRRPAPPVEVPAA